MSTVTQTVTELVQPILADLYFNLFDIEYVKEGKNWYLRVYVDKPGGITIEDCAQVSDRLSARLDELDPDPIPDPYFLEVSSPGAERPLRNDEELEQALNQYISLSLHQAINGKKSYEGVLKTVTDIEITLEYMDKSQLRTVVIPRAKIAKARLALKF